MDNMTAKVSCFARAYHQKNNKVHIFEDFAAEKLMGEEYDQIASNMTRGANFFIPGFRGTPEEGLRLIVDKQLAPSVLGRSAFCEKMLQNEMQFGCSQYVVFAAGYDTFSIRNPYEDLRVFELDLPELLRDKAGRIEKYELDAKAIGVPCDLALADWKDKLMEAGFKESERTFASLLGISYYLPKKAFRELLKAIYSIMPKGSTICFDYPNEEDGTEAKTNQTLAKGAGEEMKAKYSYGEIELLLQECGFLIYEHLNDEDMTREFFEKYNKENPEHAMKAPKGVSYVTAAVYET